ncbi:Protein of unknown function [Gryllus bimaculatus]|nr:Protein of unknown function [Gryllus bimaculatus]
MNFISKCWPSEQHKYISKKTRYKQMLMKELNRITSKEIEIGHLYSLLDNESSMSVFQHVNLPLAPT